jgi:hypothetical protein
VSNSKSARHHVCRLQAAFCLSLFLICGCARNTSSPSGTGTAPPQLVDSRIYNTGDFEGCPATGTGGDPALNLLKNRDRPPPVVEAMTIGEILANHPSSAEAARGPRRRWPASAQAELANWENRGVILEGCLLRVKQEGPESCNCRDETKRDYHLWIAASAEDSRDRSVIAEVSPRLLPSHPNWRLRILTRLAKDRVRVRVSGWMMWDQEHPDQVGQTRGTQWEIHPIHKIEVWSGGRWRDLDG